MHEIVVIVGCLGAFALTVFLLLHFWPRPPEIMLDKSRKSVQVLDVRQISPDTRLLRLSTGDKHTVLGLPVGKHIKIYGPNPPTCIATGLWNEMPDPDKGSAEISRTYAPITGNKTIGYVDILVKCYNPGKVIMPDGSEVFWENGGKLSRFLHQQQPGDYLVVSGPFGFFEYVGKGFFSTPGKTIHTQHICMMAGGSGITPMLQLITACLDDSRDSTSLTLLYANKTEEDILGLDMLQDAVQRSKGRLRVHYTLDHPPAKWHGKTGFISAAMCREVFVRPTKKPLMLLCGPPKMVEGCKANLTLLSYPKDVCIAL